MGNALKPTFDERKSGDAAIAIDTLLNEGISPTVSGAAKLKDRISSLDQEITQIIANSPATIKKSDVGLRLQETLERAKKQVNPQADMDAIKKAWMEFRNHPDLIGQQDIRKSTTDERHISVMVNKRRFETAPWMCQQAEDFKALVPPLVNIYGVSITVHGDGLIPHLALTMGCKTDLEPRVKQWAREWKWKAKTLWQNL